MANTLEIKKRIKSIKNTAKITHAMELVSAAKMKRAQNAANAGKPYSDLIGNTLRSIAGRVDPQLHPLLTQNQAEKTAVVFVSTDRGLAGAINANLFRETIKLVGKPKFVTLGKKARNFIIKSGLELVANFPLPEKPTLSDIRPVSKLVIEGFLNSEFDQVHVLFSKFISTLSQDAITRQILPIVDEKILGEFSKQQKIEKGMPLFEPNADIVLEEILPQYILMELYQVVLEAKASEHSARMVAMKNATDNALELTDDLTLAYNGIRQAAITNELLDITTAQGALE